MIVFIQFAFGELLAHMCHTLYIFPAATACSIQGTKVISGADFHPCQPFFVKYPIPLESIRSVRTTGVLETTPFVREVIKRIDDLVAVDGVVYIDYFSQGDLYVGGGSFRSFSFFMNEWSISTEGRFNLEERTSIDDGFTLRFRKMASKHLPQDTTQKWSFGVVSDGRKNGRIRDIIGQIEAFGIAEFEVIVCGPSPYEGRVIPPFVQILPDADLYTDIRVPISRKKNRIIEAARYENIVLMHDRITFATDWYKNICAYGNAFDILCPQILAEGNESIRVQDWLEFNGEFGEIRSSGRQLNYDQWSPRVYIDGGFLIAKTRLLRKIQYSPFLHWGEGEDVDLSRRLYQAGALVSLFTDLKVKTETHRHRGLPIERQISVTAYIKHFPAKLLCKLRKQHRVEEEAKYQAYLEFCDARIAGKHRR